jgi:hypothetical protein
MRHPPYHLRLNKAVDRGLLVETLRRLDARPELAGYTYYGFGGPFLEDCRLMGARWPELRLVSFEANEETFKRQCFHKFSSRVELMPCEFGDFLTTFHGTGTEIFWLDYTGLTREMFNELQDLLTKAAPGTVVKVTLQAEPQCDALSDTSVEKFRRKLRKNFGGLLPDDQGGDRFRPGEFPQYVQGMVQIAAQQALPASAGTTFQLLHSTVYADSLRMLSVAGIVCARDEAEDIKAAFSSWKFANLTWARPTTINVPALSVRERLRLDEFLPSASNGGGLLAEKLGYAVDRSPAANTRQLQQYADFHCYYPYLARVSL